MLQQLQIQNYAIIDNITVDFSTGLNIITGETGAGKSILIGALGLILGERADSTTLMDQKKKCIIEGHFEARNNKQAQHFLTSNELDPGDDLVIRREISAGGKSRSFINDTPVNLSQLKHLSLLLVDLHQQFDTLELGDSDFQRQVLDALAANGELLNKYREVFNAYTAVQKELTALQAAQQTAKATLDYNQFLFDELEESGLKENELEELNTEIKLLSNAEDIKQQLGNIFFELKGSELPVVQQLKALGNKLSSLEEYHPAIQDLYKRLRSAQEELLDIAGELESIEESVQYDPERIQVINDRLSLGYRLLKKHAVNTTNELREIKDALQGKLGEVLNIAELIAEKDKAMKELLKRCNEIAWLLSNNRNKTIDPFIARVNSLLLQVGMPNAQLKVRLQQASLNIDGMDEITFLFDANKSGRFEPLNKVASGGELSRIMLCIKSLVARKLELPTLIFDEIDSGISGEAARQVGIIMKDLSAAHQLISITHQPQIAAKATAHYFVYKAVRGDRVTTSIRLLGKEERINTIAQMLSGEKPTAAALANAKEMVGAQR